MRPTSLPATLALFLTLFLVFSTTITAHPSPLEDGPTAVGRHRNPSTVTRDENGVELGAREVERNELPAEMPVKEIAIAASSAEGKPEKKRRMYRRPRVHF